MRSDGDPERVIRELESSLSITKTYPCECMVCLCCLGSYSLNLELLLLFFSCMVCTIFNNELICMHNLVATFLRRIIRH